MLVYHPLPALSQTWKRMKIGEKKPYEIGIKIGSGYQPVAGYIVRTITRTQTYAIITTQCTPRN